MVSLSPRGTTIVRDVNFRHPILRKGLMMTDLQEMQEDLLTQEMQDRLCQMLGMFSATARALILLRS